MYQILPGADTTEKLLQVFDFLNLNSLRVTSPKKLDTSVPNIHNATFQFSPQTAQKINRTSGLLDRHLNSSQAFKRSLNENPSSSAIQDKKQNYSNTCDDDRAEQIQSPTSNLKPQQQITVDNNLQLGKFANFTGLKLRQSNNLAEFQINGNIPIESLASHRKLGQIEREAHLRDASVQEKLRTDKPKDGRINRSFTKDAPTTEQFSESYKDKPVKRSSIYKPGEKNDLRIDHSIHPEFHLSVARRQSGHEQQSNQEGDSLNVNFGRPQVVKPGKMSYYKDLSSKETKERYFQLQQEFKYSPIDSIERRAEIGVIFSGKNNPTQAGKKYESLLRVVKDRSAAKPSIQTSLNRVEKLGTNFLKNPSSSYQITRQQIYSGHSVHSQLSTKFERDRKRPSHGISSVTDDLMAPRVNTVNIKDGLRWNKIL